MGHLGNKLLERIYYVNNGIIYNIGGIVENPDKHGIIISATTDTDGDNIKDDNENIEKIFIQYPTYTDSTSPCCGCNEQDSGKKIKYFLDSFIEDGDKYVSSEFKKVVHEKDGDSDTLMSYFEYYKYLCEQQIRKAIAENANLKYKELVIDDDCPNCSGKKCLGKYFSRLGVPAFMIQQASTTCCLSGMTVKTGKTEAEAASATLIDLSENNFNTMKKEQVARLIEDNAIIMADGYGYELKKDDLYSTILSKLTPKS